jgi:hypothetical protein
MADYRYVLYDTATFNTSGSTNHILFQVGEGADSSHPEYITNMRGNGALPTEEAFTVQRIHVWNEQEVAEADIFDLTDQSLLELRVSDKTLLKIPLRLALSHVEAGGHFTQATAAARAIIGHTGYGFELPEAITIPGGTRFSVRVYQSNAFNASTRVKVALEGILSMP